MEVMWVWLTVIAFVAALVNLIYWIAMWSSERAKPPHRTSSYYSKGHSMFNDKEKEAAAAKKVVRALILLAASITGPVFLLWLAVYGFIRFLQNINKSLNPTNQGE